MTSIFITFVNALAAIALLAGAFLTQRTSVLWLSVASLVTLAVLKRVRPLWIAPFTGLAVIMCVTLLAAPIDIEVDSMFPRGVWITTPAWGLPSGPMPRDARGVPEFWWGRSCLMPSRPPERVIVIGIGRRIGGAEDE